MSFKGTNHQGNILSLNYLSFFFPLPLYFSITDKQTTACTLYMSIYLSICISVYLSICLSVYLSICLYVYMSICLSVYLSICLSVYLSICLSVYLSSVYLSICLFISLFRPSHSFCLPYNVSPPLSLSPFLSSHSLIFNFT